jgi:hypothetical protein
VASGVVILAFIAVRGYLCERDEDGPWVWNDGRGPGIEASVMFE